MPELHDKLSGKFLVVDGPDGAGKSTQLGLLADWLRQNDVQLCQVRDPGGTAIGDKIRQILLDRAHEEMAVSCELMLYMASRAQLVAEVVRPALQAGKCVLSDRYISSTLAYQGAGGADTEAIRMVADIAVGKLWPDLTIILDIASDAGLDRVPGKKDRMESKDISFHRRVRELFLAQAAQQPERYAVVPAGGSREQVQEKIRQAILEKFK